MGGETKIGYRIHPARTEPPVLGGEPGTVWIGSRGGVPHRRSGKRFSWDPSGEGAGIMALGSESPWKYVQNFALAENFLWKGSLLGVTRFPPPPFPKRFKSPWVEKDHSISGR